MSARDILTDHALAFAKHVTHAAFTGLFPVLLITLVIFVALRIAVKEPTFSKTGALFALVGSTVGILLGASREPAVQAVVPALVTLITGYLGWTLREEALGKHTVFSRIAPTSIMATATASAEEKAKAEAQQAKLVTSLVFAAVIGLMLGTITGTMWGSSMRFMAQDFEREYDQWKLGYEKVQLPLELERNKKLLEQAFPDPTPTPAN